MLVGTLAAGCAKKPAAPAPAPPPPLPTEWPQGKTAPLKITEELSLEIPLQYVRAAISGDHAPAKALLSAPSDRSEAAFDFFLPDFSGYTLKNYRNVSDANKVEVVYLHAGDPHEGEPGAAGAYPPNLLKRALGDSLDPQGYKDQYGLRCYQGKVQHERLTCYGKRDAEEDIILTALVPPYPADLAFPQMQARYFSKRYGGVRLYWRTHVQNLPRWHDIDAQVWKFIAEWKVETAAAPEPVPGPVKPGAKGS